MPVIETHVSGSIVRITEKTPPAELHDRLQTGTSRTYTFDVETIERELRGGVKGEVRFSDGDRGMYASDAGNYRMVPVGVVLPKDADDVAHTAAVCRR